MELHRKVHLFDIDVCGKISFKESDTLNAGKDINVIIIQDINLDEIDKIREEIPVLKNRRTDLYEIKKL